MFLLQETNLVDICKNRLAEAILTNIHNICFLEYLFLGVLNTMFLISLLIHLSWAKDLICLNYHYNEFSHYIECRYKED